jgi:hypothetical protein
MDQETRNAMRRQTVRLRVMTEPGGYHNSMERLGVTARKTAKALIALRPYLVEENACS